MTFPAGPELEQRLLEESVANHRRATSTLLIEAADTIAKLRAEVAEYQARNFTSLAQAAINSARARAQAAEAALARKDEALETARKALEPFAEVGNAKLSDFRAAREALRAMETSRADQPPPPAEPLSQPKES